MFGIIFIILFGVIFYVLAKSFKNNAIAGAVGLGLSLFISIAVAQRGLLYEYGGGELSSWALLIGILIAIAFLIRFAGETFGRWGAAAVVLITWIILHSLNPYEILPSALVNSRFLGFYEAIFGITSMEIGIIALILLMLIATIVLVGSGPKTGWDYIEKAFQRLKRR